MTWNHLTKSKNSSAASIQLWLVSNSSYWPERIKTRKNCSLFKTLTCKNFRIVCRNKVIVAHQKCTVLVSYTKFSSLLFLTDVFSLTSSTISSKNVLQKEFWPFSCFLWWTIPNCVHLDPCTLNFDQFYMTWNHLTKSKNMLPPSNCGWSQLQATDQKK